MRCYCCNAAVSLARKVKLRPWREFDPRLGGPDSAAYQVYREEMTYRWAVVCHACYRLLDDEDGRAEIGARTHNLASASRGDRAAVINEEQYQAWQRKEANKLGLDI
jgi:hypothetical protein